MLTRKLIFSALFILFFEGCTKNHLTEPEVQLTHQLDFKFSGTGITLNQAQTLGRSFLQAKQQHATVIIRNSNTITRNGKPYFHIINTNAGFVILSADSLYKPILAYDTIGNFSFDSKHLNPGLVMWLNKHSYQIDLVRNHTENVFDSIRSYNKNLWRAADLGRGITINNFRTPTTNTIRPDKTQPVPVSTKTTSYQTNATFGPLVENLWGQDYPFNYYCKADALEIGTPYIGFDPAGCTPVAVAQLMSYWQYPTTYNWASMPVDKAAYGSLPAANDVARLIHDLGLDMQTTYSSAGSTTSPDEINNAFADMGYKSYSESKTEASQAISGAEDGTTWANLLISNIQSGWPCIVSGWTIYHSVLGLGILPSPGGEGHTWVCDGSNVTNYYSQTVTTYSDGSTQTTVTPVGNYRLLHMNWGWDDYSSFVQDDEIKVPLTNNGWYDCDINYTQADANSANCQYFQILEYNIHP